MKHKEIELELRAEVKIKDFNKMLEFLKKQSQIAEESRRLTIMFIGKVNNKPLDIRIRIKKGKEAEIVFKVGDFHSHDRLERCQIITRSEIVGLARCFSMLGMSSKVTERDNYDFILPGNIEVALVKAKRICYIEFEKKASEKTIKTDKQKILSLMSSWNFNPIDKTKFDDLCDRLSKFSDRAFNCTGEDISYLQKRLKNY